MARSPLHRHPTQDCASTRTTVHRHIQLTCVRINNTISDWFTISSGVRQSCVAAPDLFNCIIDYLMENVSAMVPGIQLGQYHLTDMEYADDASIFATNQNDISSALAIFDTEACKLGLGTSWAKTKIMKFGDVPSPPSLHILQQ